MPHSDTRTNMLQPSDTRANMLQPSDTRANMLRDYPNQIPNLSHKQSNSDSTPSVLQVVVNKRTHCRQWIILKITYDLQNDKSHAFQRLPVVESSIWLQPFRALSRWWTQLYVRYTYDPLRRLWNHTLFYRDDCPAVFWYNWRETKSNGLLF